MLRKRLISFLFLLPLLVGVCIAAYRFGPNPSRVSDEPSREQVSRTEPAKTNDDETRLFDLFASYQAVAGKGTVSVTPVEYLNSVEKLYRQRGYQKLEALNEQGASKRQRSKPKVTETAALKFFQRDDTEGAASIIATGTDANYVSNDIAVEPYTFTTLVVASPDGGTDWATYRIAIDRNKIAKMVEFGTGD